MTCGIFSKDELRLDAGELSRRLLVPKGYDTDFAAECEGLVYEAMTPRYCYEEFSVELLSENRVDLGFAVFGSANLYKNLKDSKRAFVSAVTLGIGVDRLLTRLAVSSASKHFIADAVASAYAEAAADKLSELLAENAVLCPRFSPGYGDLKLETQKDVLEALDASKNAGITLNESLLMTPLKTITAIQGIKQLG